MHDAEHAVAVAHGVYEDPDRGQVVDLSEVFLVAGHLLPHGEDVLGPARDVGGDSDLLELAGEDVTQVGHQLLALVTLARDPLRHILVRVGLEVAEREVLELPLDLPDAEPVRQWRVDVERLA